MSDFSQGTCAELGSMFLGVREKINAKKDKDRPRCSCRQCEPKGDTSIQVQGANPQSSKLQGAQCECKTRTGLGTETMYFCYIAI